MSDQKFKVGDKVTIRHHGPLNQRTGIIADATLCIDGWRYSILAGKRVTDGPGGSVPFAPLSIGEAELVRLQKTTRQDIGLHALGEVGLSDQSGGMIRNDF